MSRIIAERPTRLWLEIMVRRLLIALVAAFAAHPALGAPWRLVWSDEFDKPVIDVAKWNFEEDCWGGGNNERQCYTAKSSNSRIVNGKLTITALRQKSTGPALPKSRRLGASDLNAAVTKDFTSARLTTKGKGAWRYGKIEVRARLPQGQGAWPAIWMMPQDNAYGGWAASGEIDILEAVNLGVPCPKCPSGREDTILGTLHFGDQFPGNHHMGSEVHAPEVLEGFHTYTLEWREDVIVWKIDGRIFATRTSADWWTSGSKSPTSPFDQDFYLIINMAIGGGLAEDRGLGGVSTKEFPKTFAIDWVRVWQEDGKPVIAPTG